MIYEYIFTGDQTPICYESDIKLPLKSVFEFRDKKYTVVLFDERKDKTILICLQLKH